ncbi:ferrous iron transport protein A [Treponema sp. OMZ 840]|uniref:FeoA family protein n=1 Tax=Treponema sp. OMZ 840 TaxID=244313 RepID=UPI003D906456
MTVVDLKPGQTATVSTVGTGDPLLKRRILDMGITPGVEITMIKSAPLGDPLEITLRGYQLSLRKHEAQQIHLN